MWAYDALRLLGYVLRGQVSTEYYLLNTRKYQIFIYKTYILNVLF